MSSAMTRTQVEANITSTYRIAVNLQMRSIEITMQVLRNFWELKVYGLWHNYFETNIQPNIGSKRP
jgi:hypothetical protein